LEKNRIQATIGYMKPAHLLMTLLVLANVLLWAVGFTVYDELDPESQCLAGLLMAHAGLLGIWLGLGRMKAPLRLTIVSVSILLFHAVVVLWRPEFKELPVLLVVDIICVSVLFLLMRMLGLKLIRLDDSEPKTDDMAEQTGFQFSLGTMFAWTTAVAVLLSALATIGFQQISELIPSVHRTTLYFVVPSFFPTLLWLWAVLGMRTMKPRIIAFVLVPPLASIIYAMLLDVDAKTAANVLVPENAVLLLSLIVCRVAGYRIVWRRRTRHAEHDLR
jgi:hypothetical protein